MKPVHPWFSPFYLYNLATLEALDLWT